MVLIASVPGHSFGSEGRCLVQIASVPGHYFGSVGRGLVLIALVPGHYLHFTFGKLVSVNPSNEGCLKDVWFPL